MKKLYLWLNATIYVDGSVQTLDKMSGLIKKHVDWCGDDAEPGVVVWMHHGRNIEPKPFYRPLADWPWTPDQLRDMLGSHAVKPDNIVIYYGHLEADETMRTLAEINARATWFDRYNEMTREFRNFSACYDAAITYEGIAAERLKREINAAERPVYVESWNGCDRWQVPGVTMAVGQYVDRLNAYPAGSLAGMRKPASVKWDEAGLRSMIPTARKVVAAGHHPIIRSWMWAHHGVSAKEIAA